MFANHPVTKSRRGHVFVPYLHLVHNTCQVQQSVASVRLLAPGPLVSLSQTDAWHFQLQLLVQRIERTLKSDNQHKYKYIKYLIYQHKSHFMYQNCSMMVNINEVRSGSCTWSVIRHSPLSQNRTLLLQQQWSDLGNNTTAVANSRTKEIRSRQWDSHLYAKKSQRLIIWSIAPLAENTNDIGLGNRILTSASWCINESLLPLFSRLWMSHCYRDLWFWIIRFITATDLNC